MRSSKKLSISAEQLEKALEGAKSKMEVMRRLGWKFSPTNYEYLDKLAAKHNKELPVWDNRLATRDAITRNRVLDEDYFVENSNRKGPETRRRLIAMGRPFVCANVDCLLHTETTWRGQKVVYQVDHIDGDHRNNQLDNLRFLCPICHSQTDTYAGANAARNRVLCECGRKKAKGTTGCPHAPIDGTRFLNFNSKCKCGTKIDAHSTECVPCFNQRRKIEQAARYSNVEELVRIIEKVGYVQTGKMFGVSDNAIRKYLRSVGVNPLPHKNS